MTINLHAVSQLNALSCLRVPGDVVGWLAREVENQKLRYLMALASRGVPRREVVQ